MHLRRGNGEAMRMRRAIALIAALAVSTSSAVLPARAGVTPTSPSNACEREMAAAAQKYDVPLAVLYAVGLTESGQKSSLQPLAMNIAGKAYYASDLADALQKFTAAEAAGVALIDVGCMQIDQHYHGDQFPSVAAMFDPHANVDYGARLLGRLYVQEGSWTLAVARYHAGPGNEPAQKQYVCRVMANMVASGFGGWTDAARSFCA
jgi:soluble lytic murein transglycosylase-like protein